MELLTNINKTGRAPFRFIAYLNVLVSLTLTLTFIIPALADPPDNYAPLEQLASFTDKANAIKFVERLEADRKVAFIVEKKVGGQTFYSVVLDKKPSNIVKSALERKFATKEEAAAIKKIVTGTVIIPTRDSTPGASISLDTGTVIYSSRSTEDSPLGTYSSLGGAVYVKRDVDFFELWLPQIERKGYVPVNDARETFYTPDAEGPL